MFRVSQAFPPSTESWRKPVVPDFVHAQRRTLICIFCFSLKLSLSERGCKCFEERAQKEQWWATGSTLLLRAVRILVFTRAQKSKKTLGEEDKGLLFGFGFFFPKKSGSTKAM